MPPMTLLRTLAVALLLASTAAHAQLRTIPGEAKRGEMRHVQDMVVAIDGEARRLAPGAQIRDPSNRVVMPAALPRAAEVKYLLNAEGLVRQVWILTPEEAAKREEVKNGAVKN
jgi:hypothetical protein